MVVVRLLRDFLLCRMNSSAGSWLLSPGRVVCLIISTYGLTTQKKVFTYQWPAQISDTLNTEIILPRFPAQIYSGST
jgi:uncharacterized membrane protein